MTRYRARLTVCAGRLCGGVCVNMQGVRGASSPEVLLGVDQVGRVVISGCF